MPDTPTYNFYIKKTTESDYPQEPTGTSENASYTFEGLEQGESYDIKVEVADKAGNTGTGILPGITTDTIPDPGDGKTGSIVWGNIQWNSGQGTASVTVSKGSGVNNSLKIQYQIVSSGGSISDSAYQEIANGGTISSLTHGSVVYARLWDGNNAGSPASLNIQDNNPPSATIKLASTATTGQSITATITQTDSESGVASGKYIFNTTSGNIGINESSYTGTISGTSVTVSASTAGTYYLHVLTIDRAGNKKETISGAVTVKAPEVSAEDIAYNPSQYYGKYVNYIPKNNADVKWRIFYAGTNPNVTSDTTSRIYLIADDYISSQYAPNGKKGTTITEVDGSEYMLYFSNLINDYWESSDITNNSLVRLWLSCLDSLGVYGWYNNMLAVAYMLDTSDKVWGQYKDAEGKAEYAIGGANTGFILRII